MTEIVPDISRKIVKPSTALLERLLPAHLWEQAHRQARRSNLVRFGVGAVIFDGKTHELITRGCAHYQDQTTTTHAEAHALSNLPPFFADRPLEAVIVTLNHRRENWASNSRPCHDCAQRLRGRGISFVHYAHRDESGHWMVCSESVDDLAEAEVIEPVVRGEWGHNRKLVASETMRVVC